jgi:CDP-6-deoxy-D-xylo-4-hexulose-3-dehydrase
MTTMKANGIEFRRGLSGGGNQVRQPWVRKIVGNDAWQNYPKVDHVHSYGFYIGNYPHLEQDKILHLCDLLNAAARQQRLRKSA